ncbi:SDR family NAD(P)-dependent oxidoreductase [Streptomonospora nanhaiensis]|uniref:SDR family NAD(P)-dependent oxidoreductase n=5 Tax=Streptomonospora nanhaiensis TaxID=1323731 RepID=UPI0036073491
MYGRAGGVVVGSVKANIAHAQAAAGVAGLVNLVGIVGRGVIPRLVGAEKGGSKLVDWKALGLELAIDGPRPWAVAEGPRIGAVSSFGISGTNAHLILEQPPADHTYDFGPPAASGATRSALPDHGAPRLATAQAAALRPSGAAGPTGTAARGTALADSREDPEPGSAAPCGERLGGRAPAAVGTEDTGRPTASTAAATASAPVSATATAERPSRAPVPDAAPARHPVFGTGAPTPPWPVSARSEAALAGQARRLLAHLEARPDLSPHDVGFSLATTRTHFEHRAAVLPDEHGDHRPGLAALADGTPHPAVLRGVAPAPGEPAATVFVFPGQGAQWPGMAADLLGSSPVFADAVAACERALAPHLDWSLGDVLRGAPGAPALDRVEVLQPALFAMMVGLAEVWRSLGVRPDAVVGHSQGEIAAAYTAGALTLEDAARVIALRSRLAAPLARTSGLLVVALPAEDAAARLRPWGDRLTVAAVNSPEAVVVAGDRAALGELAAACAAEDVDTREVGSAFASHSPHVEPVRRPLLDALAGIAPRPADVPFLSTVEGAAVDGSALGPDYWYANLRRPVLFASAVRAAAGLGRAVFVEVSPHPVLRTALVRTLEAADREDAAGRVVATLRRGEGGPAAFTASLADAYVHGAAPSWRAVYSGRPVGTVHLPTYAFQHRRYWAAPTAGADASAAGLDTEAHPLLGAAVTDADTGGLLLTGEIAPHRLPWLADHAVAGTALLPGAALADLALHAGDRAECPRVAELAMLAPVRLPAPGGRLQVQVRVGPPDGDGHRPVRVHSRPRAGGTGEGEPAGEWTLHAEGVLAPEAPEAGERPAAPAPWPPAGAVPLPLEGCYDRLARRGYHYGAAFQGLRAAWRHGDDLYAEVALHADRRPEAAAFALHPALLDAALHPLLLAENGTADARARESATAAGATARTAGAPAAEGTPSADAIPPGDERTAQTRRTAQAGTETAGPDTEPVAGTAAGRVPEGSGAAGTASAEPAVGEPRGSGGGPAPRSDASARFSCAGGTASAEAGAPVPSAAVRGGEAAEAGPARPVVRMPFAWEGVRLHAADAVALRVRLSPVGDGAVRLEAFDADGAPVVTVDALTSRPFTGAGDGGAAFGGSLFRVDWVSVGLPEPWPARECACVGTAPEGLDPGIERYPDLAALREAVDGGRPVPSRVLLAPAPRAVDAEDARAVLHRATAAVRAWLADDRFADSVLAVLTRAAAPITVPAPNPALPPPGGPDPLDGHVPGTSPAEVTAIGETAPHPRATGAETRDPARPETATLHGPARDGSGRTAGPLSPAGPGTGGPAAVSSGEDPIGGPVSGDAVAGVRVSEWGDPRGSDRGGPGAPAEPPSTPAAEYEEDEGRRDPAGSPRADGTPAAPASRRAGERTPDAPVSEARPTADPGGGPLDLGGACVWGLVRAAQNEHPGRFLLVDLPPAASGGGAPLDPVPLLRALASDEPRLAVRGSRLLAPRVVGAASGGRLLPPEGAAPWRVEPLGDGTMRLRAVPNPAATRPLRPGEVRVSVRAAGLNFRDVLLALGVFARRHDYGAECAGVVTETGPGVTDLVPGDRVAGIMHGSFGTDGVADRRLLARVPAGWTDVQAAAAPVAYLTAYHALVDLAALRPGEKVLVHAAAGGVGLAAVHLARHLGAEVYGTASPAKWPLLRAAGLAADRLATSRTLDYADRFARATGGTGVDVVLNALTGDHVDASLGLLAPGGRFVEIGATDVRRPEDVAAAHPHATYRAFQLDALPPERLQALLREVSALLDSGALRHLPATAWPLHRAHDAFRLLQQGRNTGKLLLRPPAPLHPRGTVLITGGTGRLGALTARHLVRRHGVRRLVLAGRRGPDAPGADRLAAELTALGAEVEVRACDAADADALADLLAAVPADRPLTAVVHAAGALADSVVADLTPDRLDRVLAAKARAAWNLHTLTRDRALAAFVLYSSAAAVLGPPGQAGYAAANAYLDALAEHRHALGLPAASVAWGLWAERSALTAGLGDADMARMRRLGVAGPLATERALALLDTALAAGAPHLLALPVDTAGLRAAARRTGAVPPLFRALVRAPRRGAACGAEPAAPAEDARSALAARAPGQRRAALLDLVRRAAAAVLGHPDTAAVGPDHRFLELGVDSLTAVELRNRLAAATGLRLPAGLVFRRTTPAALAAHLADLMAASGPPSGAPIDHRTAEGADPAPPARPAESAALPDAPGPVPSEPPGAGASGAADAVSPAGPAAPGAPPGAPAPPADGGDEGVVALFRRSCATGRTAQGLDLLRAAARLRPIFETAADLGAPPAPVRLAPPAPGRPRLVCLPSLVMISGAHEYARFAAALRGRHEVAVLPHPGFAAGEPLPGDVAAVVDVQTDAVLRACGAEPAVLVGRSSGGWIAHAVAERLERRGHRPAGLVLLDTPLPDAPVLLPVIETGIMARDTELGLADAARATAMAAYLDLFAAWAPRKVGAPTAQVRPADPVPDRRGAPQDPALWRLPWPLPHDTVEVPGDHLTMLEAHAESTAAAVAAWAAGPGPGAGGGEPPADGTARRP